jgi:peptidoglycan/xylan/chitin deacetylase (PgdA/CDA1 family)
MYHRIKRRFLKVQNQFRPKSFILLYHRITDLEIDPWDLAVSTDNFEEQLIALKEAYNVISLNELIEDKKNRKLKERSIAITFDDGYKDNYTAAYPILIKHQVPATFFISSAYIESQNEFWWDKLIRFVLTDTNLPKKLELKSLNKHWDISKHNFDEKSKFDFFMDVWGSLLQVHPNLREQALSEIETWSNHDKVIRSDHLPMSKTELIDMAQHPLISIEAHTNNHAALGYLDQNSQREEIQSGKRWLEKVLNKPITGFSYPNGSYNGETISLMAEIGFEYACTTEEFRNSNYISDYKLPRFQVCNWNEKEFINRLEQW